LNTRFLNPLPSNSQETILLQIEDDKPTVFSPKALKWDKITIADVIELQEPQHSAQIKRRDINQIIEEPDRRVILKFRSLSSREDPSLPGPSNYRRSFSECSSQTGNLDHSQRYRFRSPILEPIVDPPSPTSSGIGNTINVLTKLDFGIDGQLSKKIIIPKRILHFVNSLKLLTSTLENKSRKNGLLTWNVFMLASLSFSDSLPLLPNMAFLRSTLSPVLMFKLLFSKFGTFPKVVLSLQFILWLQISNTSGRCVPFGHPFSKRPGGRWYCYLF